MRGLYETDRAYLIMQNFCEKAMGSRYVNQDAFSPSVVMGEASSSTPIFFILFPGYSPSKEIEAYARDVNHTVENGKLTLISMGQVSFSYTHLEQYAAMPFDLTCMQQLMDLTTQSMLQKIGICSW